MAFATERDLVNLKHTKPNAHVYGYTLGQVPARNINRAVARQLLRTIKQRALNHQQGNKYNRPWYLKDVTENLDPQQAWMGWEFELGFRNREDYERIINYMWQRQPYSALDTEGYGTYSAELTFSPANAADVTNEKSGIWQLLRYMKKQNIVLPNMAGAIGTHLNLSTPGYRNASPAERERVAATMNVALTGLTHHQKTVLFGRQPYGYAFRQEVGDKSWIEFKLFKSTQNIDQFRGYVRVAERMALMMEMLSTGTGSSARRANYYDSSEARDIAARSLGYQGYRDMETSAGGVYPRFDEAGSVDDSVYRFLLGQTDEFRISAATWGIGSIRHFYHNRSAYDEQVRDSRAAVIAWVNGDNTYVR